MTNHSELDMLRESAIAFAVKEKNLAKYRSQRNTLPGFDKAMINKIAELGWLGIMVPEEYDGLGLGIAEIAEVVRRLGGSLMAEPITATAVFGTQVLTRSSNEKIKRSLLPKIAMGEYHACPAFQSAQGGIEIDGAGLKLANDKLSGQRRYVAGAALADAFLVVAQDGERPVVCLVEKDAPGLSISYEWRNDGSCLGVLDLENVSAGELVCDEKCAPEALANAFDTACIVSSAEMLGIMETVLEMTLEYMRNRVQFDKPIGSFQALQHKTVDLYILKEISSGVLREALTALPADPKGRGQMASRVKSRCSDAVMRITRECIQLHGAIGVTYEYDLGLYVHRAMALSAWLGNGSVHRKRIRALGA